MLEAIVAYIERYQLLPVDGNFIVAVSGGADSLCLLHILHRLCGHPSKRYPSIHLHVAHLDHKLRGPAGAGDAAYVAQIAASWGLPATLAEIDVPALARQEKRSLEDAARVARYRFLRQLSWGRRIAVAHHADDQVETLMLHWLRGAGLASMMGMPPRQGDIIRPLLAVQKAEITLYCQQHGLQPLQDASNTDLRFWRNRVRHELLPLLESMNPALRATLLRNAEVVRVDAEWIEAQVDSAWSIAVTSESVAVGIKLDVDALLALPLSIQRHLLRRVTARLCQGQSPLELRHFELIELLLQGEQITRGAPKQLDLPGGLHVNFERGVLVFEHATLHRQAETAFSRAAGQQHLPLPGRAGIEGTSWTAAAEFVTGECLYEVRQALQDEDWSRVWRLLPPVRHSVYIDAEGVGAHLLVRTRRPGDRIQPLGMVHEKKVQDVLVDTHVARAERASLPLFFSASHCVWLAGVCLDERVKLSSKTQRIIRLSIEPRE
jgi:tRNA(Ile)-lysidine synthase